MTRQPVQHTAAWIAASGAKSSARPKNRCAIVRRSSPSSSTSSRTMTMSMNTPIHKVRLMNSGAMADP